MTNFFPHTDIDGHETAADLASYADGMDQDVAAWMAANGVTITEDGVTVESADALRDALAVAIHIMDTELHGDDQVWNHFGLSSDDDVDYAGWYFISILENLSNAMGVSLDGFDYDALVARIIG